MFYSQKVILVLICAWKSVKKTRQLKVSGLVRMAFADLCAYYQIKTLKNTYILSRNCVENLNFQEFQKLEKLSMQWNLPYMGSFSLS